MEKLKIGITCGAFDLLHSGHLAYLRRAKEHCEQLFVLLQTDPTIDRMEKNRPIQELHQRAFQLLSCVYVDQVIPYDTETNLLELIQLINPNARFLGTDYLGQDFTGKTWCNENTVEIIYLPRDHSLSSSGLRKKIKES